MKPYKFRTGQTILCSARSIISESIEHFDKCDISHAAKVYDENYVVDARGDFPNHTTDKRSIQQLIDRSDVVYVLTPMVSGFDDIVNRREMQRYLDKQVGKGYDYFNVTLIQIMRLFGLKKLFQKRISTSSKKWQCGELAVSADKYVYGLWKEWPNIAVSPKLIKHSGYYHLERIK